MTIHFRRFSACVCAVWFAAASLQGKAAADGSTPPDAGQVMISVAKLLEQGHFRRSPLGDDISRRLLRMYLENLDYNRLYFTQEDVDLLEGKYETELDDYILLGNPKAAYEIQGLYAKRVENRVAWIKERLAKLGPPSPGATVEINRQKAAWPKDAAESDLLWENRLRNELLQEKLDEQAVDPPEKVIDRRYNQALRNLHGLDREDVINGFLSALAYVYDPHSEYLGPSELTNFEISMKLSLVGIGAVLRSEDGYARITDLVAGGPAQMDGRLRVGDRVSGVAQGDDPFVDVVDMKLDKVVELIRGKKGTKVRLQVVPTVGADVAQRKLVEIIRDEVKLKEQEAKAEIIERTRPDGSSERLGWITLPSFYADLNRTRGKESTSTTRDVARLLARLKQEGIRGLVIDLRRNGGGSLEEAVNLTGLFIRSGPVVQAKDSSGEIKVSRDVDPSLGYEGPLVVLTSRLSASASEIFAGALQDYGRAVIVGDESTFGKGTVQTMLDLARFLPPIGGDPQKAGALKLTIQQFYRVSGDSTQLRGVLSDIRLPSVTDNPEVGEAAMRDPLPFDEVEPLRVDKTSSTALPLNELRRRSTERVGKSREFRYVLEDIERLKERLAANALALDEAIRRRERDEEKQRRDRRNAERKALPAVGEQIYAITLDNVDQPGLQLASVLEKEKEKARPAKAEDAPKDEAGEEEPPNFDAERAEALNIVSDLFILSAPTQTASRNP